MITAWITVSDDGPGPWSDEPGKVHWIDDITGLPCLALRNVLLGSWHGYVALPNSHVAVDGRYQAGTGGYGARRPAARTEYGAFEYVKAECAALARSLTAAGMS